MALTTQIYSSDFDLGDDLKVSVPSRQGWNLEKPEHSASCDETLDGGGLFWEVGAPVPLHGAHGATKGFDEYENDVTQPYWTQLDLTRFSESFNLIYNKLLNLQIHWHFTMSNILLNLVTYLPTQFSQWWIPHAPSLFLNESAICSLTQIDVTCFTNIVWGFFVFLN